MTRPEDKPDDARLNELIDMADDSTRLDDPAAAAATSPQCLSMSRLDRIARGRERMLDAEQHHVAGCALCQGRLEALRTALSAAPTNRVTWWPALLAAAAVIAISLTVWLRPGTSSEPAAVIAYVPGTVRDSSSRPDAFTITPSAPGLLSVALFTWDADLERLAWVLDSASAVGLKPDESMRIELDTTMDPPVEQWIFAVLFPESTDPALGPANLLDCLNDAGEHDAARAPGTIEACLPAEARITALQFTTGR